MMNIGSLGIWVRVIRRPRNISWSSHKTKWKGQSKRTTKAMGAREGDTAKRFRTNMRKQPAKFIPTQQCM
jgi:hypothetical protein